MKKYYIVTGHPNQYANSIQEIRKMTLEHEEEGEIFTLSAIDRLNHILFIMQGGPLGLPSFNANDSTRKRQEAANRFKRQSLDRRAPQCVTERSRRF